MELVGPNRVIHHPAGLEEPGAEVAAHGPLEAARPDPADRAGAPLRGRVDVLGNERVAVLDELLPDGTVEGAGRKAGQVVRRIIEPVQDEADDILVRSAAGPLRFPDDIAQPVPDFPALVVKNSFFHEEFHALFREERLHGHFRVRDRRTQSGYGQQDEGQEHGQGPPAPEPHR